MGIYLPKLTFVSFFSSFFNVVLTVIFCIFGIPGGVQTCSELQLPVGQGSPWIRGENICIDSKNGKGLPELVLFEKFRRKALLTRSLQPGLHCPTLPLGQSAPMSQLQYSLSSQSSCLWQSVGKIASEIHITYSTAAIFIHFQPHLTTCIHPSEKGLQIYFLRMIFWPKLLAPEDDQF